MRQRCAYVHSNRASLRDSLFRNPQKMPCLHACRARGRHPAHNISSLQVYLMSSASHLRVSRLSSTQLSKLEEEGEDLEMEAAAHSMFARAHARMGACILYCICMLL